MMFGRTTGFAAISAGLLLACPAWADDESTGVIPGTFRAEPGGGVTVTAVHVTLGEKQVEVLTELDVRNAATLRLDLPRFGWLGEGEPYPDRQFPELSLSIDGHSAPVTDSFAAWADGQDVSRLIRAAGLDPFLVTDTPPIVAPAEDGQAAIDALIAAKAVARAPEGLLAHWSVQRQIGLPVTVGRHTVAFRYKPRPAFALVSTPIANDGVQWADYCLTPRAAGGLLRKREQGSAVVVQRYTIPVGINGVRPQGVVLSISGPWKAALTATCSAKGRVALDPKREQPVRTSPDGSVHVLQISRPP